MSERDLHDEDDAPTTAGTGGDPVDLEAPEADTSEQRIAVGEPAETVYGTVSMDVDEADSAEQQQVVELDEDDYR